MDGVRETQQPSPDATPTQVMPSPVELSQHAADETPTQVLAPPKPAPSPADETPTQVMAPQPLSRSPQTTRILPSPQKTRILPSTQPDTDNEVPTPQLDARSSIPTACADPCLPTPGAPTTPICLSVGHRLIELPAGIEVELGRHSPWKQISKALTGLTGVSRHHAIIVIDGDRVLIRDLQSMNGTWIDGYEITSTVSIQSLPLTFRLGMSVEVEVRKPGPDEHVDPWTGEHSAVRQ